MNEWIVFRHTYGFETLAVVKRTEKQVVAKDARGSRDRHIAADQVLAFLTEDRAKAMFERLVSSKALEREDCAKAAQRHRERVERIKAEFSTLTNTNGAK